MRDLADGVRRRARRSSSAPRHASRSIDTHAFTALNTAFMHDGAVIAHREGRRGRRRRSTCSSSPTRRRRRAIDASAQPDRRSSRNAKATVIESYVVARRRDVLHQRRHRGRRSRDGATLHALQDAARERSARSTSARSTRGRRATATSCRSRFATGARALAHERLHDARRRGLRRDAERPVHARRRAAHATTRRGSSTRSRTASAASCTRASSTAGRTACSTARCTCIPIAQKTDGKQTNNTLLLSEHGARSTPSRSSRSSPTT